VIGAYEIPYFPDTYLLEVLIHLAPRQVDFGEWLPYQPPAADQEWGNGLAHFYFDRDGLELTGSYLTGQPMEPYTRAGLLLDGVASHGVLIRHEMHWISETTPIPERLLRLIWVEEGMPFAGPYEALGG
jgi:hypothetical protein